MTKRKEKQEPTKKPRRYKASEAYDNTFLRIPKALFVVDEYRKLSSDAKLLYGFLNDRKELSLKNNWIDEEGYIYLIFTRKSVQEKLCLSDKTVTKAFEQLRVAGLIEEKVQGLNKPNLIYVCHLDLSGIENKGLVYSTTQDSENLRLNETEKYNNTEILNGATEDSSALFFYFIEAYKAYRKEEHPIINGEELKRVLKQLEEFTYEDEIQMIDKYFTTNFKIKTNYQIWHYLSEGVRELRMYETIY